MTRFPKQNKFFVSALDQILCRHDADHPQKSPTQQIEIDRHAVIAQLRDNEA